MSIAYRLGVIATIMVFSLLALTTQAVNAQTASQLEYERQQREYRRQLEQQQQEQQRLQQQMNENARRQQEESKRLNAPAAQDAAPAYQGASPQMVRGDPQLRSTSRLPSHPKTGRRRVARSRARPTSTLLAQPSAGQATSRKCGR